MRIAAGREIRFVQALHSRAFAWFWGGQAISALGDGAFATALAVAVYQLTGSSLAMGLFLMAQILPQLLFTLIGGVAADRLPRRLVLLGSDAGRAAVVFAIALLAWLHLLQLWHLFVLAVLFGVVASFFHPSYRALTPELVSREQLASANALTELSVQLGSLLGPMLGAGLIALSGGSASMAFAFDGLTFVASVCSLGALCLQPQRAILQADEAEKQIDRESVGIRRGLHSMWRDIRDGFGTIRRSTWLLCSMVVAAFALMCYRGAMSVTLPKLVFAVYVAGP